MKTKTRKQMRESAFKDALAEGLRETSGRKLIDKKSVTFHTKEAGTDSTGSASGGVREPTSKELSVINTFTQSPKAKEEVAVFETLSANTLEDRDEDFFTRATIQAFAKLPEPYGPVGKSYMTGHDYSTMPVGRIFEVDTKTVKVGSLDSEGKDPLFLTNKIYVPRTDQYKDMLENIDFGINWAVSVGVMLESVTCTVCDKSFVWFFCENGHVKGEYYDPNSDETDSWGWPEPVPADTKGAVKSQGRMEGAKDFYELSQCFLGAQFFAGMDKMVGVVKSAHASKSPFVGLSRGEAQQLPFQHLDERVVNALATYEVERLDGGVMKWLDDSNLVWNFTPGEGVLCLGKHGKTEDPDAKETEDGTRDQSEEDSGQQPLGEDQELVAGESDDESERVELQGDDVQPSESDSEEQREDGSVTESADDTSEEDDVSKRALLAAARRLNAPAAVIAAIAEAPEGEALDAVFRTVLDNNTQLTAQVSALTPKAAMGEEYLKSLRSEAIDWYVKSHQTGDKGVNTDTFSRVLDACGDNAELIKSLSDEQRDLAQVKFPASVRRSSADRDPNAPHVPDLPAGAEEASRRLSARSTVRRLHG